MAAISTGLDFHTLGLQTAAAYEMRALQSDQEGGTDSGDAAQAWTAFGQTLRIMDGHTFDEARADLVAGRLVHLDVWAAAMAPAGCPSGTGQYGHTIAVAPEQSGTRWLVSDPWCSPGKWTWIDESLLREAAETWGEMCYAGATSGRGNLRIPVLIALMRLIGKRLMTQYRPDAPALVPPSRADTGGSPRIMFTTTGTHDEPEPESAEDVMYNVGPLTTHRDAIVKACSELYSDSSLTLRHSAVGADTALGFLGSTAEAHVVVNAGNTNYVRREDVLDIVPNDRTYE